ncbi:MAG: hypothetical protein ACXWUG_08010 [Polyangiales bacterium]
MRFVVLSLALALTATACGRRSPDITRAPEKERKREEKPPPLPDKTPVVTTLVGHAGDVVSIEGRLLAKAKPRVTTTVTGKSLVFVDVDGSHLEVATYVAELPSCEALHLTGKVIVATGMAKSGTTEGFYAEPQLDVAEAHCL